jgi:hypothetical protein
VVKYDNASKLSASKHEEKKNVYTLYLVFVKIEEIQRNYKIVLLSPFHGSLEKHVLSK